MIIETNINFPAKWNSVYSRILIPYFFWHCFLLSFCTVDKKVLFSFIMKLQSLETKSQENFPIRHFVRVYNRNLYVTLCTFNWKLWNARGKEFPFFIRDACSFIEHILADKGIVKLCVFCCFFFVLYIHMATLV